MQIAVLSLSLINFFNILFIYLFYFCCVSVTRPPFIVHQPDYDVFYKAGETVEMPCYADGIPRPM
jgi:hypothetical protein